MISYRPFFNQLLEKNITGYELIYKEGITIHRMKHGFPISTRTLDVLCFVLSCRVEDIIEYVEDE